MHESQLHADNYFATYTYSDENLPANNSLYKKHMQDFWKRYRKKFGKVRMYYCGEYGETTHRPHYHALVFGHRLPDLEHHSQSGSNRLYISETLNRLWGLGHTLVGDLTFESASYVARYATKKLTGPAGKKQYEDRGLVPPYCCMSRRPGIGSDWYDKFNTDVYPSDEVICRGKYTSKPPRYYDEQLKKINPDLYNQIKATREEKLKEIDLDLSRGFRLYAASEIAKSRLKTYQKNAI